jgi:hypothetical protein
LENKEPQCLGDNRNGLTVISGQKHKADDLIDIHENTHIKQVASIEIGDTDIEGEDKTTVSHA